MARTYDFAVLRLEPDAARGEVVNVGLVIFDEASVDVRVGEILTRARALLPDFNSEAIEFAVSFLLKAGAVRLTAADRHRTLSRVGLFRLGELGHFTVSDEQGETYEYQINRLMNLFVSMPRRIHRTHSRSSRLVTEIRSIFRDYHLLASVGDAAAIDDHKIVPEWPIPTKPSLKADLALKNGIMRVAQVVDLSINDAENLPPAVFSGVVTLEVAGREAAAAKRVFAYRASGDTRRVDEALRIADMHATELVDLNNSAARDGFLHDWISAASEHTIAQAQILELHN